MRLAVQQDVVNSVTTNYWEITSTTLIDASCAADLDPYGLTMLAGACYLVQADATYATVRYGAAASQRATGAPANAARTRAAGGTRQQWAFQWIQLIAEFGGAKAAIFWLLGMVVLWRAYSGYEHYNYEFEDDYEPNNLDALAGRP